MDDHVLGISLQGRAAADESDYVIIEQKEWPEDVGRTSISQGILAIGSMIFGGSLPDPNCGGLAGFETPVYVYPSRSDLEFIFRVSHGEYVATWVESLIREEIISCGLEAHVRTEYPVDSMLSVNWLGPCYDAAGNIVTRPDVSRQGRDFYFTAKVLGSVQIRYMVHRKTYMVHIEEREDSIENNFECVAYCVGNGFGNWEEIKAPSGYDGTMGNCGNGIYDNPGICQPDWGQGTYPKAVRADRLTKVDYCSQETTSDEVTESVDKENEPGEECSNEPLVTN